MSVDSRWRRAVDLLMTPALMAEFGFDAAITLVCQIRPAIFNIGSTGLTAECQLPGYRYGHKLECWGLALSDNRINSSADFIVATAELDVT